MINLCFPEIRNFLEDIFFIALRQKSFFDEATIIRRKLTFEIQNVVTLCYGSCNFDIGIVFKERAEVWQ